MLQFKKGYLRNGQRVIYQEYQSAWGWGWEAVKNLGWT